MRHQAALRNTFGVARSLTSTGCVVWASFPYVNGDGSKVRPAVVLRSTKYEVEVVMCTTKVAKAVARGGIPIEDLSVAGLERPTAVMPGRRVTVPRTSIVGIAGRCSQALVDVIFAAA